MIDTDAIASLHAILGDRLVITPSRLVEFGRDLSHFPDMPPEAVAFPTTTAEVQQIVRHCAARGIPIIAQGARTSLEGHILAPKGGLALSLSLMDRIIAVNESDLDVRVQPGITRKRLNADLRDTGLFFPIDPGADASIGGMASTRASGTNAVRYGTMKQNVLSLQVVLPNGEIITTARRARKSSAGYDLTSLFVGSEGTLGIITEITLQLYGIPECTRAAVCQFAELSSAIESVIETIQYGIPIARIELLDEMTIRAVNAYSKIELLEAPTLFMEFHGGPDAVAEQVETVSAIIAGHGGQSFDWAEIEEDRNRLWEARHSAAFATAAYAPGTHQWYTDVCVPISSLAETILATKEDIARTGLFAPILGHVGDGNFHLIICAPENDDAAQQAAHDLHSRLIVRALNAGGTCTGEHGIGIGKTEYLEQEMGHAVSAMRAIKYALDPDGIMNPGKIFKD